MSDTSALGEVLKMVEDAAQNAQQAPDTTAKQPGSLVAPSPVGAAPVDDGPDPTEVKPMWYWIKDSRGYGSVTTTLVFVSFWITTIAYILSLFDHIGPISIRPFDVSACSAYFIPLITLYFGRKATEAWKETQIKK